jgi:uncharacterized protein with PIN domain
MQWRTKLIWILIGLTFVAMVYLAYGYGTNHPNTSTLNAFVEKYEVMIEEKDKIILEKDQELKKSEMKYTLLVNKIKKKAAEAQNIKPPTSVEETKRRFNEAGYPTR